MVRSLSKQSRRGFTLIELLVVIGIIATLAALTIGAAFTVLTGQRSSNTEDFMRNTDKLLAQQWRKVVEDARKEDVSNFPAILTLAGGAHQNQRERAQVLLIKFRLMEAFPQDFNEINNPWVYTAGYIPAGKQKYNAGYVQALTKGTTIANNQPQTQSAACLFLALSVDRGVGRLDADKYPSNILDTDNDGVKELVDNWGNPLTFIRFPIGSTTNPPAATLPNPPVFVLSTGLLAELNQLNPAIKSNDGKGLEYGDPEDPQGWLSNAAWLGSANGTTFHQNVHTLAHKQPYFIPVLISNGPDGVFNTPDDIYGWRLRVGAKGN
jgi:prepilin-type N-terminal cleavage/methylation domain-containing protein